MSTSFYAKNPYGVILDNQNNFAIKVKKPDRFIQLQSKQLIDQTLNMSNMNQTMGG